MSKRFRDSGIWGKEWFCKLSPTQKCLWDFITDNCDNAGVWSVNKTLAEFQIGSRIEWNTNFEEFHNNLVWLSENKILVTDFINFQYGELKNTCGPHKQVLNLLEKHGLKYPFDTLLLPLKYPISTLPVRVLDKDKDKDKDKKGDIGGNNQPEKKFEDFTPPEHLKDDWPAYLATRKKKKATETYHALELVIRELEKISSDHSIQIQCLQKSIRSGWTDVYPLKQQNQQQSLFQQPRKIINPASVEL